MRNSLNSCGFEEPRILARFWLYRVIAYVADLGPQNHRAELNFALAVNQAPSEDAMHRLIERADLEKFDKAKEPDRRASTSRRFNRAIDRSRSATSHSPPDGYLAVWQLAENRASQGIDRMPRTPVLLTPYEVAELLRTSRKAIYTMIERAQLPGIVRIGRRVLVREDALLDWLRQKSTPSLEGR
jgi:excisionase family DNA binding protein